VAANRFACERFRGGLLTPGGGAGLYELPLHMRKGTRDRGLATAELACEAGQRDAAGNVVVSGCKGLVQEGKLLGSEGRWTGSHRVPPEFQHAHLEPEPSKVSYEALKLGNPRRNLDGNVAVLNDPWVPENRIPLVDDRNVRRQLPERHLVSGTGSDGPQSDGPEHVG
jgi:hypothetical protein